MKLEINLQYWQNRNRYKAKEHSDRVACILADHYNELKSLFDVTPNGNYLSMSNEDIFSETILYVIQDKKAFNMSETDLIKYFKYKYNMISFQIINDSKTINIVGVKPDYIANKVEDADNQ